MKVITNHPQNNLVTNTNASIVKMWNIVKIENIYLLSNAPGILVIVQTYLNTTKFTCLVNKRKLRLEFVAFEGNIFCNIIWSSKAL